MDLLDNILNKTVQRLLKRYSAGDYLFRQGEAASTMYFIVNGTVKLQAERPEGTVTEGVLETGQFLGEKVLLQEKPYKRVFSALCETDVLCMEITQADVADIEKNDPVVMTDLLKTVLSVVGGRFDLMSFLAQGLRSSDDVTRVVNVVRYFSRSAAVGEDASQGFVLSEEAIAKYTDTDRKIIRWTIKGLLDRGILEKTRANTFVLADEPGLLRFAQLR
jgi:CRP-like cAMP-binding protein